MAFLRLWSPASGRPVLRIRHSGRRFDRRLGLSILPPTLLLHAGLLCLVLGIAACAGEDAQPGAEEAGAGEVVIHVPRGATFSTVVDTLEARDLVGFTTLFRIYSRARGADTNVRAGSYALPQDASWNRILQDLTEGRVRTVPVTIPEGFTLRDIAPRIAPISEIPEDSALATLRDPEVARALDVPGPTLEGYLYPDTYRFAPGVGVPFMASAMVSRYEGYWTPERVARLDSLELTERELVTLASVVQAEAARIEEMDTIASVYHNRLERQMRLEADPTVLYALGGHRERLLYPAMDSVADNPYNTYTHPGLPPGPIGSPGEDALDATLWPARTDFLYFVARPGTPGGGGHVFSRTLAEHNRAVAEYRRQRE